MGTLGVLKAGALLAGAGPGAGLAIVDTFVGAALDAPAAEAVAAVVVTGAVAGVSSSSREYGGGGASSLSSFCAASHSSYDCPPAALAPSALEIPATAPVEGPAELPEATAGIGVSSYLGRLDQ